MCPVSPKASMNYVITGQPSLGHCHVGGKMLEFDLMSSGRGAKTPPKIAMWRTMRGAGPPSCCLSHRPLQPNPCSPRSFLSLPVSIGSPSIEKEALLPSADTEVPLRVGAVLAGVWVPNATLIAVVDRRHRKNNLNFSTVETSRDWGRRLLLRA